MPFRMLLLCFVLIVGVFSIIKESGILIKDSVPSEKGLRDEKVIIATEIPDKATVPETVPETTEEIATIAPTENMPVGSEGPVDYEIIRWDRSYTNTEGRETMSYYYDYVKLNSGETAHIKINDQLYEDAERFMNELTQEQIETPVMSVFGTPTDCIQTMESEITQNGQGFLSVQFSNVYYMGGNHSIKTLTGATYSLKTGERVGLQEIFIDMDQSALLRELRSITWNYLTEHGGPMLMEDASETLERYTLEQFDFVVRDGQIVLLLKPYAFMAGASGYQMVPTGLYL